MTERVDAAKALRRADDLEATARRSSAYLVPFFRAWAVGSVLLGIALWLVPRMGPAYYMGCLALWVVFVVGLLVFYFRDRPTRPRRGPVLTLGIVGGSVPWSLGPLAQQAFTSHHWWIAGLPWLAAGVITGLCLMAAAELARRRSA